MQYDMQPETIYSKPSCNDKLLLLLFVVYLAYRSFCRVEICTGTGFQSHPHLLLHSLNPSHPSLKHLDPSPLVPADNNETIL